MTNRDYYGYSKQVHELAEKFIERDILACQTALIDEILNNCPHGLGGIEIDNIVNYFDEEGELQEIYEWWQITYWLARELEKLGEPILYADCSYYWGRTCTGQHILLDGTIQQIALKYSDLAK